MATPARMALLSPKIEVSSCDTPARSETTPRGVTADGTTPLPAPCPPTSPTRDAGTAAASAAESGGGDRACSSNGPAASGGACDMSCVDGERGGQGEAGSGG